MFRELGSRLGQLSDPETQPTSFLDKATGIANTVLDFSLRPAARAATALIKTFTGDKSTITPTTTAEKVFYGDKPVGDIEQFGNTYLEGFGYKPKTSLGSFALGAIAAPIDLFVTAGKGTKQAVLKIAQEAESIPNILNSLKKFKISDNVAQELAPKLTKISDKNVVATAIKNAEIVTEIEKKTGIITTPELRSKIGEMLSTQKFDSPAAAESFINKMQTEIINTAPKYTIPDTLQKVSYEMKKFSSSDDAFDAFKKMEITPVEKQAFEDSFGKMKDGVPTVSQRQAFEDFFRQSKLERVEGGGLGGKKQAQLLGKSEDKIQRTEKSLLKTRIQSEQKVARQVKKADIKATKRALDASGREIKRVAKQGKEAVKTVSTSMKKSEANVVKRIFSAQGRQMKRIEKQGAKNARAAKSMGKKMGIFKTKAKDRRRIKQIYQDFRNKRTTEDNFRNSVRTYASDLPLPVRRKILSQSRVQQIRTGKHLQKALSAVDRARYEFHGETKRLEALRNVKQTMKVVKEKGLTTRANTRIMSELGITSKSKLLSASEETLSKVKSILDETLTTTKGKVNYDKLGKVSLAGTSSSKTKELWKGLVSVGEKGITSISTNLAKYGGDKLKYAVRKKYKNLAKKGKFQGREIQDFMKGMTKLRKKAFGRGKADYDAITRALYNQDFDMARKIAEKRGFSGAFEKVVRLLDSVHGEMSKAGIKVGKLENYFPRIVSDYDGLFKAYNEKFGAKGKGVFDKLLNDYAKKNFKTVNSLTIDERAEVLTNVLRGYGNRINAGLGKLGLARKTKEIQPEFIKYYNTPEDSLIQYLTRTNEKIENVKLLGVSEANAESIGRLVDGLNISPNDANRLREVLTTIIVPAGKENSLLRTIRSTATITLLGHIQSALVQFGDIWANVSRHGLVPALASFFRKKPFKRDEMFFEIAQEFQDSKAITRVLKATGFDALDKINNQAFMGAAFRKGIKLSKKGKGSEYEAFVTKIKNQNPEKWEKVIDDFKAGKITDETESYVYNEVLDISPRAITEMPELYVKHPNMRALYAMKTYSIKILDVYRNDVLRQWKSNPKKAAKNFIMLTSILTMSGATADQIKNWYNGKDSEFSDDVFNNLFKIAMLSSYDIDQAKNEGVGRMLMQKALPPTRLVDDISKDLTSAGDGKGLQSVRDIPLIGQEIYNRFGKGKDSIAKANAKPKAVNSPVSSGRLKKTGRKEVKNSGRL